MIKHLSPQLNELNFFEINILTNHYVLLDKEWTFEHSIAPFSRLYYVKAGRGKIFFNNETVEMLPGNVYLIPPDVEVSYSCEDGDTLEKVYFHIFATTSEKYDLLATLPQGIYALSLAEVNAENLFSLYPENSYLSILEIKNIVYRTVVAFFSKYHQGNAEIKHYSKVVRDALNYIQGHYNAKFSVQSLADSLFVSKSKISKQFKDETGLTIGQYNENLLFSKAKILLIRKNSSIQHISATLGFCDQFYFSRRFKKKFNISPAQYRKELSPNNQ